MQRAHTELGRIFDREKIDYTLFHGRGSLSGRGGVADSIGCGNLRANEHGESVNERYGVRGIAFRTLEKAFSAVVTTTAGLDDAPAGRDDWADAMNMIAVSGDQLFQQLVSDTEKFDSYFRLATPIDVIEHMRVGQHIHSYGDDVSRQNLPWAFAWAQSRFLLSSWFGFGTGLEMATRQFGNDGLREMMTNWPFFNRLVSDVETALAIADPKIAAHYSELAGTELHEHFFPLINSEYDKSVATVLTLRGQDRLLEKNDTLRRSIRLRNPYVDPMSLLQVELLKRWRTGNREDDTLLTALVASVNGIARGLQTSV